jgi:DNA-binding winged helix-turn-helix (wHTH) protein/tetratricopeptide (TPR) repeat protein
MPPATMTSQAQNGGKSEVYEFGDCILDADRRELRASGKRVTTQPKVFDLLLYLVRNRHRAIDKDELQDAIWPRSIVTETALTRAVMKARRAVSDDAEKQAVIRTVHGHGYRFVAELQGPAEPEPPTEASAEQIATTAPGWRSYRPVVIAAVAILAIATTWWYLSPPSFGGPVRIAVLPVDNATGDKELDWTRTGLMALMGRMLEDKGVATVGSRSVTRLAGDRSVEELISGDSDTREILRKTAAATHLLGARLELEGGLYRLSWSISSGTERPQRRTVVGQEPAVLVKQVADTIATLILRGAPPPERMSFISDDDFINETYARAMSLEFEGRYEEAQRMFQVIIDQEPQSFWPRYEYALCARNLRDFDTAERILRDLEVQITANAELKRLAAVKNALGILYMRLNRNDEARSELEAVVQIAGEVSEPRHAAIAHQNLGLVAKNRGDLNIAYDHMRQSLAIYQELDISTLPGTLQNNMSGVLIQLGDLEQAESYSQGAVEYFRLTGENLFESYALSRLSTIYRRLGALDEAEETQLGAKAIREKLGDRSGIAGSLINLSAIVAARGDLTRSLQFAREAYDIGIEIDDQAVTSGALQRLAKAEMLLGNAEEAAENYAAAEAISRTIGDRIGEHDSRYGIARAWIRLRDFDGADAIAAELLQFARDNDMERREAGAIALQAEIRMAKQEWQEAITLLEQALAISDRIGDRAVADSSHVHLAEALFEVGETDQARAHVLTLANKRPNDPDVMVLQARLASHDGDLDEAVRLMVLARTNSGEGWSADNDAKLASYRDAAGSDQDD